MSLAVSIRERVCFHDRVGMAAAWAARPLHAVLLAPWLLFLVVLGMMIFRNPQVQLYAVDRILFVVLIFVVGLRSLLLRQVPALEHLTWPLLGLLLLGVPAVLSEPTDPQVWSLFVTKWGTPFVLFHCAGVVFDSKSARRGLEAFLLLVLAYLAFTSVATFLGANSLVFPRYILDAGRGIQVGRARGPFLQSVANGVSLNLLGLVALDSFRRVKLRGSLAIAFVTAVPLAILATMTRAVWLAFAGSVVMVFLRSSSPRLRHACFSLMLCGLVAVLLVLLWGNLGSALENRLEERVTVDYRVAMYHAGWEMFQEKPLLGWGSSRTPFELARRMDGYSQDAFYFHNTYLEILVQYGLLGFALYAWLAVELFRLARASSLSTEDGFPDGGFRQVWPVMVCVYLVNGFFVVMNYQFVNGLLFTLAGLLAYQDRSGEFAG